MSNRQVDGKLRLKIFPSISSGHDGKGWQQITLSQKIVISGCSFVHSRGHYDQEVRLAGSVCCRMLKQTAGYLEKAEPGLVMSFRPGRARALFGGARLGKGKGEIGA
jgi:hypothetical protein